MANFDVYRSSQNHRAKFGPIHSRHSAARVDANLLVIPACFVSDPSLSKGNPRTNCCAPSASQIRAICNATSVVFCKSFKITNGLGLRPLTMRGGGTTEEHSSFISDQTETKVDFSNIVNYPCDILTHIPTYSNSSSNCTVIDTY